MHPLRPALVIGATYFAQGLVYFVGVTMLSFLAQLRTPLDQQVGLLATGALPWVLKFAIGVLLDLGPSWPLRVRALVLVGLLGCASVGLWAVGLAWAPGVPVSLLSLGLVWFALNMVLAVQDAIVDGVALDLLADRRAWAATAMAAGHALGFLGVGTWWVGARMVEFGFTSGVDLALGFLIIAACSPLLLWAPGRPAKARDVARGRGPAPSWAWMMAMPLLAFAAMLGTNITSAAGPEFLFGELGWTFERYAARVIPLAALAGLVGALAFGPIVRRFGPARTSAAAMLGLGLAWMIFASLHSMWAAEGTILVLAVVESVFQSGGFVGLYALALLAAARFALPVTGFVIMMAALNLARVVGPLLAPSLVTAGWGTMWAVCGAGQIVAAAGLASLTRGFPGEPEPRELS